jgi:hypothetical protein
MQEFSSVTASSYDAASLTPLLNEKAAEGWEVVSIVSAGTSIVAYLSRESDGAPTETPAESSTESSTDEASVPTLGEVATPDAAEAPVEEAPTSETPVEEPAGWAAAPESTENAPEDDSIAGLAAQVGAADAAAEAAPVLETTDPTPAAEAHPAAEEPAATPESAPAAEPAVPAGWYADPSGRFELRYWDGTAWTEHVSRAGQQFTDPPVA